MSDDKPFQCTEPGCNMRFTNEDHLTVHKSKHAMSLAFSATGSKAFSFFSYVVLAYGLDMLNPRIIPRIWRNTIKTFRTLTDQTPTPTKFLKNCDEMGIFHDLTKNPFDDAFKKAADALSEGKSIDLHGSSPFHSSSVDGMDEASDILHTPNPIGIRSVPIPYDARSPMRLLDADISSSHSVYSPLPEHSDVYSGSTTLPSHTAAPSEVKSPMTDTVLHNLTSTFTSHYNDLSLADEVTITSASSGLQSSGRKRKFESISDLEEGEIVSDGVLDFADIHSTNFSFISASQEGVTSSDTSTLGYVTQLPWQHIESVESQSLSAGTSAIMQDRKPMLFQLVPVTQSLDRSSLYLAASPSDSSPVTLLSSHLPSPLVYNVPSLASPKSSSSSSQIAKPLGQLIRPKEDKMTASNMPGITNTTREKLKAAIRQNVQQTILNSNLRVMSDAVELITTAKSPIRSLARVNQPDYSCDSASNAVHYILTPGSSSCSPQSDGGIRKFKVEQSDADTSTPTSQSAPFGENEEARRQKFLERNRAAATRCRQKKKAWVTDLEQKADEYKSSNEQLLTEMKSLREEVARLKSMLLAHTDCPVTKAQQKQQQNQSNIIAEVTESSSTNQRTENNNVVTINTGGAPITLSTLSNLTSLLPSSCSNTLPGVINTGGAPITLSTLSNLTSLLPPTTPPGTIILITSDQLKSSSAAIGYDEVVAMAALSTLSNNGNEPRLIASKQDKSSTQTT